MGHDPTFVTYFESLYRTFDKRVYIKLTLIHGHKAAAAHN